MTHVCLCWLTNEKHYARALNGSALCLASSQSRPFRTMTTVAGGFFLTRPSTVVVTIAATKNHDDMMKFALIPQQFFPHTEHFDGI